ncbi:hypothetical protein ElyMa_002825100 [Elysia marginata]|uniref:Uncharacterized protein n=1 Tax=Elysia marginata TaxID=1093978 RepID=A0AAV4HRQ6_9GAST|nr:hypothetical protein ElyMa_002825100 [Elysia marginata]
MKETSDEESSSTKVKLQQHYQALEIDRGLADLSSSPANSQNSGVLSRYDLRSLLIKFSKQLDYKHKNGENELTPTLLIQDQIESFAVSQDLPNNCMSTGRVMMIVEDKMNFILQALKNDKGNILSRCTEVKHEQKSDNDRDKEVADTSKRVLAISVKGRSRKVVNCPKTKVHPI